MDIPEIEMLEVLSAFGGRCGISILDEKRLASGEELGDDESAFFALPSEIRGKDASPVKTIALMDA